MRVLTGLKQAIPWFILTHAVLATSFWAMLKISWDPGTYRDKRIAYAFNGIPVDSIRADLDRSLPPGEPVAISPSLGPDHFTVQRLTEALYPRRIDPSSPHALAHPQPVRE